MPEFSLIERLQAYCLAKPGSTRSISFGEHHPSYHLFGHFLRFFVRFILDEDPIRLLLRCKTSILETHPQRSLIQISQDMKWSGPDWRWVDVQFDGGLSAETLTNLLDDSYEICKAELNDHDLQVAQIADAVSTQPDALAALIALNALTSRQEEIERLIQPAILLHTSPVEAAQLRIGESKIGGLPDLPEGWDYPRFDGQPLAFLAQINLAEIPSTFIKAPLPSIGLLYFFSVFGWQLADGDLHPDLPWERYEEPGFSQVLYFGGSATALKRRSKPAEFKTFKAAAVRFEEILSLPRASAYARDPILRDLAWAEEEFERLTTLYFDFDFVLDRLLGSTPKHKLLGYANPIQAAVTQADTRLLCQIDSDYHNLDTDMEWGGIIYFAIPRADLENGNFSNIQSDMQMD